MISQHAQLFTLMAPFVKLYRALDGKSVNVPAYTGMIGSLLYVTASRLEIMFAACNRGKYYVGPKESHLLAVKILLRYLKGTSNLGSWYPRG